MHCLCLACVHCAFVHHEEVAVCRNGLVAIKMPCGARAKLRNLNQGAGGHVKMSDRVYLGQL